jgi:uncharacterized protein (TIGR02391 family)
MAVPSFNETHLEQICAVLADTSAGLTGPEIGSLLAQLGIADPEPGITKRKRLFAALCNRQRSDGCGNNVGQFIHKAMDPVRYTTSREMFDARRNELNQVLIFSGYFLGDDGRLRHKQAAQTLDDAEERADKLRSELRRRGVHADVLKFCRSELVRSNYFHTVLEATKSVAEKIRQRAGLASDGAQLVDDAFALGKSGVPVLAFNSLRTETERNEQNGMINLMKGMFSAFRNTTAHAAKISWAITEQDAFDLLTLASLLHRRIDSAVSTKAAGTP